MSENAKDTLLLSWMTFGISAFSTVISKTLTSPIDRVQLLLQTQEVNPQLVGKKYTGIWNCVTRIPKEEGFLAFFRGNLPKIIRVGPTDALNFLLKDTYQKIFSGYNPNTEFWKFFLGNLLSGGAAGATTLMFVYPLDFARTRLAVDVGHTSERQFKGMMDCFKQIHKSDGYKGLYRGFGTTVLGVILYRACYFGGYETARRVIFSEGETSILAKFALAQIITFTSGAISYPLDTVRRRLMMQSGRSEILYKGAFDCISKIYKNEGGRGFYRGFLLSLTSVASPILLVVYDEIFGRYQSNH